MTREEMLPAAGHSACGDPLCVCYRTSVPAPVDARDTRVAQALDIAHQYGTIDGSHHKMWVIDQMVRALTGDDYPTWVRTHNTGDEGPDTYGWEEGIAP